ncbi:MAG: acetylxylan esterase [Solirubrobacterales bacterium]|nr:acetylxylan esterase [Solirubrobacterales bacterium]
MVGSFDGAPIDVKLLLPPAPAAGADGNFPLVMGFHGWGGTKNDYNLSRWVNKGYAGFSMSDRGWGMSCGASDPKRATPPCTGVGDPSMGGYNHFMDDRFEVRDAQEFAGTLVDEGIVDPDAIGSTGASYGGGLSMALAALNDRKMLPDGSLVPWLSPGNVPMHLAAAAPEIPWSDFAYSLIPNGSTLDYAVDSRYEMRRIGVSKLAFVFGLYLTGSSLSTFAPAGTDPSADVLSWFVRMNAGEPYEGDPYAEGMIDEITSHHSSYYIDHSRPPSPLLISNGWTDDLFPAEEATRFYNRTRNQYPGADVSLMFFDFGHARGQNKAADAALLRTRQEAWFDFYLKGQGAKPANQVEALTQTCPKAAPSQGPFTATNMATLAPGEVRFQGAAPQQVVPEAGNPQNATAFGLDGGGNPCATAPAADESGIANYRLPAATGSGYTLMGSPTIVADIVNPGPFSQLAGRLVDVDPGGNETLVARGVYRPDVTAAGAGTRQVFQLHANGYRFAPGHVAKLELRPSDPPGGRDSNGQQLITVSNVDLRLPVLEPPGSSATVTAPVPKFVPPGYEMSSDYGGPENVDGDGDAIADVDDACDSQPGPASNGGCPLPAGPPSPPTSPSSPPPTPPPPTAQDCSTLMRGTPGSDKLVGTDASERLQGGGGTDSLKGRGGNDCLSGGGGADTLSGGPGMDSFAGGSGADRLLARDGTRDRVDCGGGRDRATADKADRLRHCEVERVGGS